MIFAACFELIKTHILRRKKINGIDLAYFARIKANFQKSVKVVSVEADFLYEKKLKIATLAETDFMMKIRL